MKNRLYAYFDINPTVAYPVVLGNVYKDQYNEEINSMDILLDNVQESEKLNLERPYVFVKIVNKGANGFTWNGNNYIFMLVNSYTVSERNIHDHIYNYQISLMNTVKLLEKIQCANLVITHSLVNGHKTIWNYIDNYMKFYCPKVKMTANGIDWSYEYLLNWNGLNVSPFNDTVCADMQLNECTLRQLLTSLMLQVSCIPTMNYLSLGFLDFRIKAGQFSVQNSMNFITHSNASDSYSNSLIISPSQVLDTSNEVITEHIGFRDTNSVFIKQTQNLRLETRFPIYNIEKVTMRYGETGFTYKCANENSYFYESHLPVIPRYGYDKTNPSAYGSDKMCFTLKNGVWHLKINYVFDGEVIHKGILKNVKIHICRYVSGNYVETNVFDFSSVEWNLDLDGATSNAINTLNDDYVLKAQQLNSNGTLGPVEIGGVNAGTNGGVSYKPNHDCYSYYLDIVLTGWTTAQVGAVGYLWFEDEFYDLYDETTYFQFVPLSKQIWLSNEVRTIHAEMYPDTRNKDAARIMTNDNYMHEHWDWYDTLEDYDMGSYIDMTPCFVENGKRQLLETNFRDMPSVGTLKDLAKYRYGTVGYNIGGRYIEGFSQMYSIAIAWWNETYTYFDNILKFIQTNSLETQGSREIPTAQKAAYEAKYAGMPLRAETAYIKGGFSLNQNKSKYIFSITYQPLNSFKMKISKQNEDIIYPLEQLNSGEAGLSDYDRLIRKNQDTINRIGNNIVQLTQTTDNMSEIQPLNSLLYGQYTIFKRDITLNEDFVSVKYTASKKYVMQNYFTSIVTKYRAYEYVDYNSSVVRKENKTIYCLISKTHYINGDNHLIWIDKNPSILLKGLTRTQDNESDKIQYIIKKSINEENNPETIRNELTAITYDNGFCFAFEDYDNTSAGVRLRKPYVDQSLGGIVQKWQMWNQDVYNEKHEIYITNNITFEGESRVLTSQEIRGMLDGTYSEDDANYAVASMNKYSLYVYASSLLPILNEDIWSYSCPFKVVTDKTSSVDSTNYYYYKDNAEIISQTLQFEYYTDNDDIVWNANFINDNPLINRIVEQGNDVSSTRSFQQIVGQPIWEAREEYPAESGQYLNRKYYWEISLPEDAQDIVIVELPEDNLRTGYNTTFANGMLKIECFLNYNSEIAYLVPNTAIKLTYKIIIKDLASNKKAKKVIDLTNDTNFEAFQTLYSLTARNRTLTNLNVSDVIEIIDYSGGSSATYSRVVPLNPTQMEFRETADHKYLFTRIIELPDNYFDVVPTFNVTGENIDQSTITATYIHNTSPSALIRNGIILSVKTQIPYLRYEVTSASYGYSYKIIENATNAGIKVKWGSIPNTITQFAISSVSTGLVTRAFDYIAFKRGIATTDVTYYLSFNDTRTLKVLYPIASGDNNGLFKQYECSNNTLSRICYNPEEE